MPANNDGELMLQLLKDFEGIIDRVAERVIMNIIRPFILENVYEAYDPVAYNRDHSGGKFIDAWEQNTQVAGNTISSEIAVNPMNMALDPENFIHGSDVWGDVRDMMAQYIQEGSHYNFDFNMARDYWTPIEEAVKNGEIDKIIENEMDKLGIQWVKQ
jgi:hypothetical protein